MPACILFVDDGAVRYGGFAGNDRIRLRLTMMLDDLENYHLTCLFCWEREELVMPEYPGQSALLAFQEHCMELHHISRAQLEAASRRQCMTYRYTLPDGRPFLLAVEL